MPPIVQYHVPEVEEQQVCHSLDSIPGLVECNHFVVTCPQIVETGQLVQEESADNPGSKVILEKVAVLEGLDANAV